MDYKFSPNCRLGNVNQGNVLDAFEERMEEYFFEPIKKLLEDKKYGFSATSLLASLIDILRKTENHDESNNKNREKYTTYLKDKFDFDEDLADYFYSNFRCGLLHAGCIESGGQISYENDSLYRWDDNHLVINPDRLYNKVRELFDTFLSKEDPEELYNYLTKKVEEIGFPKSS